MEILSINAERKLANIAASVGRNPGSWRGWTALRIKINTGEDKISAEESLLWAKSILESYLNGVVGRAYFCHGDEIHVICKNVALNILSEAGKQICDLLKDESGLSAECQIFDFEQQGYDYVRLTLEQQEDIFSIPVSKVIVPDAFAGKTPAGENGNLPEIHQKPIKGYPKVLLVEDDPVTRWIVRNSLKHECSFATANSANQAFSTFKSFQPDIVFLDINLPDKNGRTVLEWIVRNDPGATVVMFSSNNDLDSISETLGEGASGFIAKPFLKEELLYYIHRKG